MLSWTLLLIGLLSAGFLVSLVCASTDHVWALLNAAPLFAVVGYLVIQAELDRRRLRGLDKLKTTYEALDEQAKLIIKTDLDLNRTQEELDKKIRGLITLHGWGQRTRVLTNTEQLLAQFDDAFAIQLGYDRGFLLFYTRATFQPRWMFFAGYPGGQHEALLQFLGQSAEWRQHMMDGQALLLNQPDAKPGFETELLKRTQLASLIALPVPLKDQTLLGVVAMGHEGLYAHVTNGDRDLLSILATQLATDMENARLYEQVWETQRALELKVQERTRELERANEELKRLNRAKSDFVNAVAHELRTPLTSIKGYASILRSGQLGPIDPAHADRLGKIDKHSDDLTQLINNLLDISRIESGKTTMEMARLPVSTLLKELEDLVRPLVDSRQIALQLEDGGVPAVWADPTQMKRVFMNLLSNAIKYTPPQGTIRVHFAGESTTIHATVKDTGAGIGPEDLAHLFEEFYRAKTAMNSQIRGTGLGLTLVKKIVEAHGGKIWVESTVGQGSTFHVTLPPPPATGAEHSQGDASWGPTPR